MRLFLFFLCCCFSLTAQNREFEVNFDTDSYRLSVSETKKLNAFIATLPSNKEHFTVNIAGHTDDVGDLAYNALLSEKRAVTIADIFKKIGFSESKILTSGRGEVHPIAANETDIGKAKNRRVKIKVFADATKVNQIGGLRLKENHYQIDAQKSETVRYHSGTEINFPANTFVDQNGNKVNGEVEITYIEYRDPIDFILGNIPMEHGGGTFNSGGMFKILATQGGKPVFIEKGKKLDIRFAQVDNPAPMNFYRFDTISNTWSELSKLPAGVRTNRVTANFISTLNEATDYTGCFGDDCSKTYYQISKSKELLEDSVAVYDQFIFYQKRTDSINADRIAQNKKSGLVTVDWSISTGKMNIDKAIEAYEKRIALRKRQMLKIPKQIKAAIPQYSIIKFDKDNGKKFEINFLPHNIKSPDFGNTRWTHTGKSFLPKNLYTNRWDSCSITGSRGNYTIRLSDKDQSIEIGPLSLTNGTIAQNEEAKLIESLNDAPRLQSKKISGLKTKQKNMIDEIAHYQKKLEQFKAGDYSDGIAAKHPMHCFWEAGTSLMTDAEREMTMQQWYEFFDANKPSMRLRYNQITVSEECRERTERQQKIRTANANSLAVFQSLQIDDLGIYNCDQIARLGQPLIANATYQTEDGTAIDPLFIYLINSKVNGIFKYDGYMEYSPKRFAYGGTSDNALFAFDLDGGSYLINAADFRKSVTQNKAKPLFILKKVKNIGNKEALEAML